MATVSLRPHLIFGPGDQNLIPRIIQSALKGQLKKVGDGKNLVDVIYIDNAVSAHLKAFSHLDINSNVSGKTYFVGQEKPVILWEFINQILKLNEIDTITKKINFKTAYFLGLCLESVYHLLKIKKEPRMTRFVALQLSKAHYFNHDRAKKDLPRYTIRGEIYTVSNFDPYVFDFSINKSTNTLSGSSNCNGFSSCTYKKIERPRVRTPDKHMKWAIDAEKRYKEITEDQIAKVVIQFRDNYDYEKIWFTKIYKDF